jgi:hypothetical protein
LLGLSIGGRASERLELRPQLSVLAFEQLGAPALGHEIGRQPAERRAYLLRRDFFHRR